MPPARPGRSRASRDSAMREVTASGSRAVSSFATTVPQKPNSVTAEGPLRDAARLRQGQPGRIALVLGEAQAALAGMAEGRAVDAAGLRSADVHGRQQQGARNRRIGPGAVAERVEPAVHADAPGDRPVRHDADARAHGGGQEALPGERGIERGVERGEDDREVVGPAAGHDRGDRGLLDGAGMARGRDESHDLGGPLSAPRSIPSTRAGVAERPEGRPSSPDRTSVRTDPRGRRRRRGATRGPCRRSGPAAPRPRRVRPRASRSPAVRRAGRRRCRRRPSGRSTRRDSSRRRAPSPARRRA